jgi:hypothetical protein
MSIVAGGFPAPMRIAVGATFIIVALLAVAVGMKRATSRGALLFLLSGAILTGAASVLLRDLSHDEYMAYVGASLAFLTASIALPLVRLTEVLLASRRGRTGRH